MEKFIENITQLVNDSKGWLTKIGVPIFVVVALFTLVLYATAGDQNKGKYKVALITLLIVVVIFAAIVYIIPSLYDYFK